MPAPEGNDYAVDNDGGAPAGNQNAQTHGLGASHDGYYADLDAAGKEWVHDFTDDLLDRYQRRRGQDPDEFDKEALRNIAIDFHRIARANGWYADHGPIHDTGEGEVDLKVNEWASEIRRYNESVYDRMQKHGLLDDPESQKAAAVREIDVSITHTEVTEENVDEFGGEYSSE